MDSITNKALIIAVSIFVTISITSGILISINQMKNIYSKVYNTDTSITSKFNEFDPYDNTEKTGIDLLNTVNKYLGRSDVSVYLEDNIINTEEGVKKIKQNGEFNLKYIGGNVKYLVSLEKKDPHVYIYFRKKIGGRNGRFSI